MLTLFRKFVENCLFFGLKFTWAKSELKSYKKSHLNYRPLELMSNWQKIANVVAFLLVGCTRVVILNIWRNLAFGNLFYLVFIP